MRKETTIYGVAINDADYKTQIKKRVNGRLVTLWVCPYFSRWQAMLWRCYSKRQSERCPTYHGCTVSDDWLTFSNFKRWMELQEWEGKALDKDILVPGNNVYCSEYCAFVDPKINTFVKGKRKRKDNLMPGVQRAKKTHSFNSACRDPFTGKTKYLGSFETEIEAHQAWLKEKHRHAVEISKTVKDERIKKALQSRYLY